MPIRSVAISESGLGRPDRSARLFTNLSSGRWEKPCPGEPSRLPSLSSQAEHWQTIWSLCRRLRPRALRAGLLDSIQRVGDHPVPNGGRRELVGRRKVAGFGLAAGASSEDEVLIVVAGCAQRSLIVHSGYVAV